jgi:hypothetical protein
MRSRLAKLPNSSIRSESGPVSRLFLSNGFAVLSEGRGACSSKHALLAALMFEQGLAVSLIVGIYLMDEKNTPGIGDVLLKHGVKRIPEAHCYLKYANERFDFTDPSTELGYLYEEFLVSESEIQPNEIGELKVELHRAFLETWLKSHEDVPSMSSARLWAIREECIQALSLNA